MGGELIGGTQAMAEGSRQQKHISIDEALDRLERTAFRLDELQRRIRDGNAALNEAPREAEKTTKSHPTLAELLDGASNRMDEMTEFIHARIDFIEEMLF